MCIRTVAERRRPDLAATDMARTHGHAPAGERLEGEAPYVRWRTATFLGGPTRWLRRTFGGGTSSATITVTDGAALALVPITAGRTPGTQAYMTKLLCSWTLNAPAGAPAPDGITAILSANAVDVWVRDSWSLSPVWLAQTAWERSTATGDDYNSGAPGSPIRTFAEYGRRVGNVALLNAVTTITNLDTPIDGVPSFVNSAGSAAFNILLVQSNVNVVGAGVIAGIVKLQRNANIQCSITYATAAADIAAFRRIRLTSGLEVGKAAWLKSNPGGGRVNLGCFMFVDPLGATLLANPANINNGDTYNIEECASTFPDMFLGGSVLFNNVRAGEVGAEGNGYSYYGQSVFTIDCENFNAGSSLNLDNCRSVGGIYNFEGNTNVSGGVSNGLVINYDQGFMALDGDFQSTYAWNLSGKAYLSYCGVFDFPGASAISVGYRAEVFFQAGGFGVGAYDLYGSGNTGAGIALNMGSVFQGYKAPTIAGGAGDVQMGPSNTAFPFDNVAGAYVAPARVASWANIVAPIGGGGFGNGAFLPNLQISLSTDASPT